MAKDFLKIIYAKSSYSELDISNAAGSIYRLVWLAVSAAMTFALMVIIPKREMWFTYIGSRTLSVYIVHRLIRDVLKYAGLYRFRRKQHKAPCCQRAAVGRNNISDVFRSCV